MVATRFGRIAVMVCYDLEFPEWVRLPALSGAQLLCAPVNWPAAPRPEGERPGAAGRMKKGAGQYRRRALLPEENLIPVRLRSLPGASTRYD
ncbi:hypothetical protein EIM00_21885 [Pseudomonas aeruginosa]|uniref:CN hydrolase domain-containing protein n=2 Tax=Pseudomonas aeruginosa TaxID=287 RepID=A0A263PWX3_PSEAI|nr:hypothetical protein HW10_30780 [Pseudomonas aeruginosa]ENH94396.1 hypothetical protein H734_05877 [Pseudomonas aeruginosa PA45]OPF28840.1 hypothetical protein C533_24330 [Pseudomonas aeruginosa P47]OPF29808.1 hypothetical protein C532_24475 [Pseudomonas aeruginosa P37]OPF30645.1 hypothetical protein C531_25389 [Pseudomonas aeruginosa SD9]OPF45457.1 hypothetical protein C534_23700 [Pseudomonas aeruginosa P49]RPO95098.1 hypothetical protein IPC1165_21410 [Pseudomonas aeruginosa E2]SST11398